MSHGSLLYTYFGHHKCATQWVCAILREACQEMGLNFRQVTNQRLQAQGQNLVGFVRQNDLGFLGYTTAIPSYVEGLGDFKGFHVIRDPRDICVSAYFSHLHSHPITEYTAEIAAAREELQRLPQEEGLLEVIKARQTQFENMLNWDYGCPHILELKMEDLIADAYQGFLNIFGFLGLLDEQALSARNRTSYLLRAAANSTAIKLRRRTGLSLPLRLTRCGIPAEMLLGKVYNNRFSEKTGGRKPGEENVRSHYRKGVAGDWVNYFSAAHIAYFKEHYNDVLVRLGYERDDGW